MDSQRLEGVDNSSSPVVFNTEIIPKTEAERSYKRKFVPDTSLKIECEFVPDTSLKLECLATVLKSLIDEKLEEKLQNGTDSSDQKGEEFLKADWEDPITLQLQELLLNNLKTVFNGAVKKIVESGYSSEVAEWAILNSGIFHGSKDSISNVVDGALALLKGENETNPSSKYSVFKELPNLASYIMLEMVHVLREVRPALTIAEAMWCLLMSDLNLLNACVLDKPDFLEDSTKLPVSVPDASGTSQPDSNNGDKSQPDSGPINQPENTRPLPTDPRKDSSIAFQLGKGKGLSANSKRDMLRQKAFQLEKNCKGRITKAAFKAKVAAWGSMVVEKSQKLTSVSSAIVIKETSGSVVESQSSVCAPVTPATDPAPALHHNPASSTSDLNPCPKEETVVSTPPESIDNNAVAPEEETDETVLMLKAHKQRLEKDLQGWRDWANEKIMQAAKRLAKDRPEMKMLRQEKEEAERYVREKQALEESTRKRIYEMDSALTNTMGHIDYANNNLAKMEADHQSLKLGMQRVEFECERSVCCLQETVKREQEAVKNVQAGEMEKGSLLEKSKKYKNEIGELETKVRKAKERWDQFKLLLKHEEKENAKIAAHIDTIRAKKKVEEDKAEREAESIRQEGEMNLQKCKKDVEDLEKVISELKLESNKLRIAALSIGYGASSSSSTGNFPFPRTTKRLAVFQDNFGGGSVDPERECVMCMAEEISVVFLPCAHQVLCEACSERHEKKGMNDCPSCRTVIEKRILAKYRNN